MFPCSHNSSSVMSKYLVAASSITEVATPGSNNRKWIYYYLRLVNSCVSTAAKNTPYTVGDKIILSAARNHNKKLLNILISLLLVDIMQEIIVYLCLGSVHIQSCQTREVFGWDGRCIRFCNHAVCVCWIANDQHLQHSSSQQGQSVSLKIP